MTSRNNTIELVTKKELINLYMGKYAAFSNGQKATPVDIGEDERLKAEFYRSLVGLPLARVNAYWSRLKFSGRAKPPSIAESIEEVRTRIKNDVSAVAYVYQSDVSDEMKVVYLFD